MLQLRPAQPTTAWTPPYLLLAAAMVAGVAGEADRGWARMLLVVLPGLALDAALLVRVLEWELPACPGGGPEPAGLGLSDGDRDSRRDGSEQPGGQVADRVLKLSGPRPLFWLPAWLVIGRCRFLPDGPDKSRRRTARVNVRRRLRLGQLTARPVRRSRKVNR